MDLRVASRGDKPSSLIRRSTFSTTTMASSTSRPIASTMANMVSMLIEKPSASRIASVPSKTTGMAMVGIRVARKFCRNRKITRNTRTKASSRILTTSVMDARTKGVVSKGIVTRSPGGKLGFICSISSATPSAVDRALALVASEIAMPEAGLPL